MSSEALSSSMTLPSQVTQIRIQGRNTNVPSISINDRTIIVKGKWLRIASAHDEDFVQGEVVPDAVHALAELRRWEARPDVFTFCQKFTDPQPKFDYPMWWDNFAVIPITTYDDWFKNRIKKDVKENLRRAKREGVEVRVSPYDDQFVRGVKDLCDETPFRQGKRFWHHGKPFEAIKEVHGTYCERAVYIGAYLGEELIGFVKMVTVDNYAKTMHVISKEKHFQKRPTNALIAKAVEVCAEKGLSHFVYGEYRFLGKEKSSLADFKQRNGFEEARYPRYFVPVTMKGSLAIKTGLHLGLKNLVPTPVLNAYRTLRARVQQPAPPAPKAAAEPPPAPNTEPRP